MFTGLVYTNIGGWVYPKQSQYPEMDIHWFDIFLTKVTCYPLTCWAWFCTIACIWGMTLLWNYRWNQTPTRQKGENRTVINIYQIQENWCSFHMHSPPHTNSRQKMMSTTYNALPYSCQKYINWCPSVLKWIGPNNSRCFLSLHTVLVIALEQKHIFHFTSKAS